MISKIYSSTEERMDKTIAAFQRELATLRAGRATPTLLDRIEVDYYGTMTPLNQLAGVSAPETRLLVIQPWDKGSIPEIEKAILKSDLGLTPSNDGQLIRLAIPQLTEERRKELVRFIRKKAEETKVGVRNIRREANDEIKELEKEGALSEDRRHRSQEKIQGLTDSKIKEIDHITGRKEEEIMEL
ncbi:MAG: ribosome recycling factor [Firmicutes bacterium]|nr:ribosome recycling factor [Bacillota bacterium]